MFGHYNLVTYNQIQQVNANLRYLHIFSIYKYNNIYMYNNDKYICIYIN